MFLDPFVCENVQNRMSNEFEKSGSSNFWGNLGEIDKLNYYNFGEVIIQDNPNYSFLEIIRNVKN